MRMKQMNKKIITEEQLKEVGHLLEKMKFDGDERPAQDVEDQLADKETTFSNNPGIPPTGDEPDQTGEEALASKRFKQVVDKMKGILGVDQVPNDPAPLQMMMMTAYMDVMKFESQHKEALENLAEKLVKAELGPLAENLSYELTLMTNNMGTGVGTEFPEEEPERPGDIDQLQTQDDENPMPDDEKELALYNALEQFDYETAKRRLVNAFIQGAAMKGHFMIEQPEAIEMLNVIEDGVGEDMMKKYSTLMAMAEMQYWQMPGLADSKSNQSSTAGGSEETEHDEEDNKWVVKAKAVMLPILIHEALKGSMEVIGRHGLPDDPKMAQAVIDNEDVLYKETWDIRLGPAIWEKFREGLPIEVLENNDKAKSMLLYVLMEFFNLPAPVFLDANKRMLSGNYKDIEDIIEKVKAYDAEDELAADENLDQELANAFDEKIDEIKEEDDFWNMLKDIGISKAEDGEEFNPQLNEELEKIKKQIR